MHCGGDCGMRNEKFPLCTPYPAFRTDIRRLVRRVEGVLREGGIASARAEAEWLLAGRLGTNRTELYLSEARLGEQDLETIDRWVIRRLRGEPLQYLAGYTEFCGHRLAVSRDVLIPRPETETVVEQAIGHLRGLARRGIAPYVLDLGTGSGNIAISLAHAIASCAVVAVELSWDALRVARTNLLRHRLDDRVQLIQADWTDGLASHSMAALRGGPFDLVISNPPYVPTGALERLPREVGSEPRLSLDGGHDGLALHRRLVAKAPHLLRRGGVLSMECAESQAEPLRDLVGGQPWVRQVLVINDLAGRPRGLWVEVL